MKTNDSIRSAERWAAEALEAVLNQVSAIKLKGLDFDAGDAGEGTGILAHIDVYGHSHTLVCMVKDSDRPAYVRMALMELQSYIAQRASDATPVFIAPSLSDEAQALCKESSTGFLDREGNARLNLGEVFIGQRSMRPRDRHTLSMVPDRAQTRFVGAA
jgi:hypothetical protein